MNNSVLKSFKHSTILVAALALAPTLANTAYSQIPSFKSSKSEALTIDHRGVLTMAPLLDRVSSAVVSIEVISKVPEVEMSPERQEFLEHFFGKKSPFNTPQRPRGSSGSGVILDAKNGYVITNHHVVENADEINLTLADYRNVSACLLYTSPSPRDQRGSRMPSSA